MITLIQLWETSLLQGRQLLDSQTQKMARFLVQQTAYGAAYAMKLNDNSQLQWLSKKLVSDPKIMAATIYNNKGQKLAFSQSVTNEKLGAKELKRRLQPYPPYVKMVLQDGKSIGYIELRLVPALFFKDIRHAYKLNSGQQQMMLLIAGFIGLLLSRALSYKRAEFERQKLKQKNGKDLPSD